MFTSILAGIGLGILSLVNYKTLGKVNGDSGKVSGIVTFLTGITMCISPMIISCAVEMWNFKVGFFTLMIPFILVIILIIIYKKTEYMFRKA